MKTLNVGILAHVDAGKTSLTERLLHAVGVIDEVGSVDDGSTQTDTLALERQRGITIKSAVVSFTVGDVTVNLIDTPGHSDFIAEVERVLGVLDGVVLVVTAVEGVQSQTRVLMRALQRLEIPTLIFVNKIDRAGARPDDVLRDIGDKLTTAVIELGSTDGAGTQAAFFEPYAGSDRRFADRLADLLASRDQALLDAFVNDRGSVDYPRLRADLAGQTRRALVHPVLYGSAVTGAGVEALIAAITELLPATESDVDGPVSGTVFKVERGPAGEKVTYVRMFSGTVHVRDRLQLRPGDEAKVTAIRVFDRGSAAQRTSVAAGQIAKLWGLVSVRVGDVLGVPHRTHSEQHHFSPPSLETVVDPCRPADRGALHAALTQLADQDPLINLRQDDRQEVAVSLYGEVQKEVIQATLAQEYGVDVTFRETTTICVERPAGSGAAVEFIDTESNPCLATVGLRIDRAPVRSGIAFRLEVELGSMPSAFFTAVEQTVSATLRQGLHGWQVTDCTVTMTHSGYWARQSHSHGSFDASMSSTAGAFRTLTPLVLMKALQRAGTHVLEPIHRFELEIPADTLASVLGALAQVRGVPLHTEPRGSSYLLSGDIPAAREHQLRRTLPALTHGEGVLVSTFERYQQVQGPIPERGSA
ncbi:MAG: TetM/TetW/TetO/TetS family tetracycline resistance ribosomal protection protein [Actinomycetota bacterium]|nr:TetM/TetW/TetO/TetS family tetracycline resistance ribosomal protection protein [Actinomycetota bacterium]